MVVVEILRVCGAIVLVVGEARGVRRELKKPGRISLLITFNDQLKV